MITSKPIADLYRQFGVQPKTPVESDLRAHDAKGKKSHVKSPDQYNDFRPNAARTAHRTFAFSTVRLAVEQSVGVELAKRRVSMPLKETVDRVMASIGCIDPSLGVRVRQLDALNAAAMSGYSQMFACKPAWGVAAGPAPVVIPSADPAPAASDFQRKGITGAEVQSSAPVSFHPSASAGATKQAYLDRYVVSFGDAQAKQNLERLIALVATHHAHSLKGPLPQGQMPRLDTNPLHTAVRMLTQGASVEHAYRLAFGKLPE